MLRVIAAICLALALAPATAETTWYTFEVIVFRQLSEDGRYAERWPADPGRPPIDGAVELSEPSELSLDTDEAELGIGAGAYAFQRIDDAELALRKVATRLKHSRGYRPLLHVGWRQPGFTRSESVAVHIHDNLPNRFRPNVPAQPTQAITVTQLSGAGTASGRTTTPRMIDGTIRLSRARYLHVDVDILYTPRGAQSGATDVGSTPTRPKTTAFRMRQSRRMRSGKLHYIDHPLFGVLVLARPYKPPEPPSDAP